MDHVSAPTLRERFVAESRLAAASRLTSPRRTPARAWRNAGTWLRTFHDLPAQRERPARQSRSADVVERFDAFGMFLSTQLGRRFPADAARVGGQLADAVLPAQLSLSVGHGDYVARNIFADDAGRVTVFDPMPRWQMPRLEDVCRFVVGLRLSGLQVHTQGIAYGRPGLDERERLFLSGYFGDDKIPWAQVGCYQLFILLDKWSALVEATTSDHGGRWAGLRRAAWTAGSMHVAREARRLIGQLARD